MRIRSGAWTSLALITSVTVGLAACGSGQVLGSATSLVGPILVGVPDGSVETPLRDAGSFGNPLPDAGSTDGGQADGGGSTLSSTFASKLGIYSGNENVSGAQAANTLLGVTMAFFSDYAWGWNVDPVDGSNNGLAGSCASAKSVNARLVIGFNLLPDTGMTLAQAASGARDAAALLFALDAGVRKGCSHAITASPGRRTRAGRHGGRR